MWHVEKGPASTRSHAFWSPHVLNSIFFFTFTVSHHIDGFFYMILLFNLGKNYLWVVVKFCRLN